MRIAVISDIHGNLPALEVVLADLSRRHVDLTINLGDCASGPLWPRETLERLIALDMPTVRGNHDRWVATLDPASMGPSDRFAFDQTTSEQHAWLGALPFRRDVAPGIVAFHASPAEDNVYLLDAIEGGRVVRDEVDAIAARLGATQASFVVCGHSHRADLVRLRDGRLILNPGSVGCPAYEAGPYVSESGSPHARYAIVDQASDGAFGFEFLALSYAHEEAARRAETNGRPEWAYGLRHGVMPADILQPGMVTSPA